MRCSMTKTLLSLLSLAMLTGGASAQQRTFYRPIIDDISAAISQPRQ